MEEIKHFSWKYNGNFFWWQLTVVFTYSNFNFKLILYLMTHFSLHFSKIDVSTSCQTVHLYLYQIYVINHHSEKYKRQLKYLKNKYFWPIIDLTTTSPKSSGLVILSTVENVPFLSLKVSCMKSKCSSYIDTERGCINVIFNIMMYWQSGQLGWKV